jgi:hypothetical protein
MSRCLGHIDKIFEEHTEDDVVRPEATIAVSDVLSGAHERFSEFRVQRNDIVECGLPARQLLQSGDCTSVRFSFAFLGVNECNRDITPVDPALGV